MQADVTPNMNRKLLVSVFNAQEAREAVLGGGRIIDSEDPKSALGNISPRHIMDIRDAVMDFTRGLGCQLSTNIGEDQLLFRRSQSGHAVEKSGYETAGKSAQAAIGVAISMGTEVHPVSYVKVGVDGMEVDKIAGVLNEIVPTLRRTPETTNCQIMSVLFAQDLALWNERKTLDVVRSVMVGLREFNPAREGDPLAFDIRPYAVNNLRDPETGRVLFTEASQVSLATLIRRGVLAEGADGPFIRLNELFEHSTFFARVADGLQRTNRAVIKAMVDVTADSGAGSIMIDTSILSKQSSICLVDTREQPMVDINSLVTRSGMKLQGILPFSDLKFFVDYCHYRGIAANVAGSIESFQAQQLWAMLPELDQVSTRGSSSAVDRDPSGDSADSADTRQHRVIKRSLVRGLAPPEHGGVLNLPIELRDQAGAKPVITQLIESLTERRAAQGLPPLESFWVDRFGDPTSIEGAR